MTEMQAGTCLCERLGFDALDLAELKRIRAIVDEDARKRHGDREGEPLWGVIADCVLAHVSQHRQAKKILDVPDHVTLDQAATVVRGVVDDAAATRLILEAILGRIPDPARSTVQLAREVVDQTERWRVDAEYYRSEASNATAQHVEALSAEVAMLTGEVAATRSEAKRQIDSALARKHLLPGLSNGASLARIELNLQEVVRSLARMELRQDGKIEIVERVLAADTRPMARLQVSAMDVATSISPPVFATELRHVLADKLREAAKVAVAWEEAAIREWEPLAAGYHDGDGTVTTAIEGPYIEHRLAMAWRGQVQRMAENLSADTRMKVGDGEAT